MFKGLTADLMAAVHSAAETAAKKLADEGYTEEQIAEKIEDATTAALPAAIEEMAESITADLEKTSKKLVTRNGKLRRGFEKRLWKRWGKALTLFEAMLDSSRESGEAFNGEYRSAAVQDQDYVFEALVLLHVKAVLTGSEVLAALRTGHPVAATARARTLHELAVVAYLIAKGRRDAAERYLLHQHVEAAADAEVYQTYAERLGYEPYTDEEMAVFRRARDQLVDRFGNDFSSQHGWASEVVNKRRPTLRELEEFVQLDHLRPHYRRASHGVHAGSGGLQQHVTKRGPHEVYLTGPTNHGLAGPGHGALISLLQVTTTLLLEGRKESKSDLGPVVLARVLARLLDRAGAEFLAAHQQLERDEKRLWEAGPGL